MAPSESSILSEFLLPPAPLHAFLTQKQFTELFPVKDRSNPMVQELYHKLHQKRARHIDQVREKIADEVKLGEQQRRKVASERRGRNTDVAGLDVAGLEMEQEVSNRVSSNVTLAYRSRSSLAFQAIGLVIPIPYKQSIQAWRKHVQILKPKLQKWMKRRKAFSQWSLRLLEN